MIKIEESSFDEILPVWKSKLWPGRESIIQAFSYIAKNGSIDMDFTDFNPTFWKATLDNKIVGVISCHRTRDNELRQRGIWVDEEHRKLGIGKSLCLKVKECALLNNLSGVWSMPRQSVINFYLKQNFKILFEINKFEFGPHYIVEEVVSK